METDSMEDLVAVFQRTAPRGRSADCPESDRFWAASAGELSFADLRTLVDHTAWCVDCSEALKLARELRAVRASSNQAPVSRRIPRSTWLIGFALAAGVAGLLVVTPRLGGTTPGPALERGAATPVLHSTLAPGPQPRGKLVLKWEAYPHALRYDVTLATSDLRVLFRRSGIEQSEAPVPVAALDGLAPGTRLVWNVEAKLDDGRSVESPAFTLDLD